MLNKRDGLCFFEKRNRDLFLFISLDLLMRNSFPSWSFKKRLDIFQKLSPLFWKSLSIVCEIDFTTDKTLYRTLIIFFLAIL